MQHGQVGPQAPPGLIVSSGAGSRQFEPRQHQHGLVPGSPHGEGRRHAEVGARRGTGQGLQALGLRLQQRQGFEGVGLGEQKSPGERRCRPGRSRRRPQGDHRKTPGAVDAAPAHRLPADRANPEVLGQPIGQVIPRHRTRRSRHPHGLGTWLTPSKHPG